MPEIKKTSVLAIIVTYNGEKYIEDCLQSLLQQTYNIDIIIVDNDSSDTTCDVVRGKFPDVTLIDVGYNSGFAHANNIGIQYAIKHKYDYVMLINEDTVSDKYLVEVLLKHADNNTAVIPKIYMDGIHRKVWYAAGKIDFKQKKPINCTEELIDQTVEITFMTGCCMFIPVEVFHKTGFFDEKFFMYYEDTDLSLRMYENNVRMLYVHDTYVWHRIQWRTHKDYYDYYMERNKLLFLYKHKNVFKSNIASIILRELSQIIFNPDLKTAVYYKYKLKGIWDFIRNKTGIMTS